MVGICDSSRKAAIPLYGLLALAVSSCGGGGVGGVGGTTRPLTVTAQTLYSFGGTSTDAMGPSGALFRGSDGDFYGATYRGGLAQCSNGAATSDPSFIGCGAVFKISPTGEETVLYLFGSAPADGLNPSVLIQGSDGNFYGTTAAGGASNAGTVFKLTPGGVETTLYSFTGEPDGAWGAGLVEGRDGNFYGTTGSGGANRAGTVFKLSPQGVETVLYSFAGAPDGAAPVGQLVQGRDGNLYGVTHSGGQGVSHTMYGGTVFKVTLDDGIETILHRFSGTNGDGSTPEAGLIQGNDGNFYGTTAFGPVFKITPEGVDTTLYTFSSSDAGNTPLASLIQGGDGNFYGTTSSGGTNDGGTAFQLTPAGDFTVLYSFSKSAPPGPDTNLVQGSDGNLYGASYYGGTYNRGYFFGLVLK